MKVLQIAAHLGGGAGKAIAGLSITRNLAMQISIVLLEQPKERRFVDLALQHGIEVWIAPDFKQLEQKIADSDLVVLNWWNHPLTIHFLLHLPEQPFRMVVWNHINGCTYPYLPFSFLNCFHAVLHSSRYSLENPAWSVQEAAYLKEKSEVVYGMGAFYPQHMQAKTEYGCRDSFTIGYVGTLDYVKLHPDFIRFCRKVHNKIPDAKFWLVGKPSDDLKNEMTASSIRNCFQLAGHVPDPENYYLQFDAFGYLLNRKSYATTENSLLEAMAAGLPIVVLNQPVERQIIHENRNGYLVNNAEEYAEKMYELWRDQDRRKAIGRKAREFVLEHYSVQVNFERFQKICQKACGMEKERFDFPKIIGRDPFEAFCYFAGKEGERIRQYVRQPSQRPDCGLERLGEIFWGQNKASVFQFYRYFQECGEFLELIAISERMEKDKHGSHRYKTGRG